MPLVGRRTAKTERNYAWALGLFRRAAGEKDKYTAAEVTRAIQKLEKAYRPSGVAYVFRVASKALGLPKDLVYRFSPSDVRQVTLPAEIVERMIGAVREKGTPDQKLYLLLSTLYGPRCNELARSEPGDVRPGAASVFIRTSKGGVQRDMFVPESVRHYFDRVLLQPQSETSLMAVYLFLEHLAGVPHELGAGWHSIRRALATGFARNGADPMLVKKFFRWKPDGMYERYVQAFDEQFDRKTFEFHPFLKFWEAR